METCLILVLVYLYLVIDIIRNIYFYVSTNYIFPQLCKNHIYKVWNFGTSDIDIKSQKSY